MTLEENSEHLPLIRRNNLYSCKPVISCILIFSFLQYGTAQQTTTPLNNAPKTYIGYTTDSSRAEQQWEQKFRAIPDPNTVRENMRRLSAYPHNVGSAYDKENAEWMM